MTMIPQTTPPPLFGNSISNGHGAFAADDDADVPVFVEGQVRCTSALLPKSENVAN